MGRVEARTTDREVAVPYAELMPDSEVRCACCGAHTRPQVDLNGHVVPRCPECGLYTLNLVAVRHEPSRLDRTQFEGALRDLRLANYAPLQVGEGFRR